MFRRVLVANRGEIAVRIIRGLREAGIVSIAVFTDVDRGALHVQTADEAAHVTDYLNIQAIVSAAHKSHADALHPGYGFLSENADFAAACGAAGVVFIGPSAESIRLMGSKTEARKIARAAGVPLVPGTAAAIADLEEARRVVAEIGFPIMVKAAAGGGGKGMRRVDSEAELESALRTASSEAERAFKSGEIYIEKLIEKPRHIEIQVLGDKHGHMIHLGERECSLQRRHQKVVEECPSPFVVRHPELRERMGEDAVRLAKAAGYYNAGTIEFLVDAKGNYYFLEMNTRLQVEHPVTELVTGIDLVQWQLNIADGAKLTIQQDDVEWRGSAIECRIYAEDPENQFFPSPGLITQYVPPSGPGVRLDSSAYAGWNVPMDYDPILAKLAAWGATREQAIARMRGALDEFHLAGIRNNVGLFRLILRDERFSLGELHTGFIPEFLERTNWREVHGETALVAALVAVVDRMKTEQRSTTVEKPASRWLAAGRDGLLR
jgi:acetyl-CoA carboxylase biotin carboxylase subunit